jgi:hypothetical protein
MNWFHLTIKHAFEPWLGQPLELSTEPRNSWFQRLFAYFTGVRSKFGPLMILILFSFLGYTTFNIGSNFA